MNKTNVVSFVARRALAPGVPRGVLIVPGRVVG